MSSEKKFQAISITPQKVTFRGFDVSKRNIFKLQLKNISEEPQKVNIIPPTSPLFTVRMKRIAVLKVGQFVDIYIHFIPNKYQAY